MDLVSTASCGVKEIDGLSSIDSAIEAMREFCEIVFAKPNNFFLSNFVKEPEPLMYCYYLFTAAVYDQKAFTNKVTGKLSRLYSPYGDEFAAFITENKLGQLFGGEAIHNKSFHPDHSNKAWLWAPDREALKAWWKKDQEDRAKEKAKVESVPPPVYFNPPPREVFEKKVPVKRVRKPKVRTDNFDVDIVLEDPLDDLFGEAVA